MNVDVNYTNRNYKKRVSRDEVCLIVEVHVNCMYCSYIVNLCCILEMLPHFWQIKL